MKYFFFIVILLITNQNLFSTINNKIIGYWINHDTSDDFLECIELIFTDNNFQLTIGQRSKIKWTISGSYILDDNSITLITKYFDSVELPQLVEQNVVYKNKTLILDDWGSINLKKRFLRLQRLDNFYDRPQNINDAIYILKQLLHKNQIEEIKNTKKNDLIGHYHFSLGRWIRNNFGLLGSNYKLLEDCSKIYWSKNDKLLEKIKKKNKDYLPKIHPDEASSIIIELFWESL